MSVSTFPQHPRLRIAQWSELSRWDVSSGYEVPWQWSFDVLQPLSAALTRRVVPVVTEDLRTVPIIDKISFGGQLFIRPEESRVGYKGRLFWAVSGELVYSKIRVKQGSVVIVPPDVPQVAVSNEYPVFSIRPEVAHPEYLALVLRSHSFKRLLDGLAHGGSSKTRISAASLESLPVPLPPLAVQQAILDADAAGQAQVAALRAEAEEAQEMATASFLESLGVPRKIERPIRPRYFTASWSQMKRWSIEAAHEGVHGITEITSTRFPTPGLGTVGRVSGGVQKSPENRPGVHPRPYLRVANVKAGRLDLREIKYINVPDAQFPLYQVLPGDLLFVEGKGSRNELGRSAIWNGEIENCVHQNHLIKVRFDTDKVLPKFAERWFNTQVGRMHFFRSAKTSSGLGTINSNEVRSAPIPLPSLAIQQEILADDEARTAHAVRLRQQANALATETTARVEAMILGTL